MLEWWRNLDFGTVPDWVGTLGTLAAFSWAVFLYYRSLKDKEMEQARLISVIPLEPQIVSVGGTFTMSVDEGGMGSDADYEYVPDPNQPDVYTGLHRATSQLKIRRIEVHNRSAEVAYGLIAKVGDSHGNAMISTARTVYLRPGEHHTFAFLRNRDNADWFTNEEVCRIWVYFTDNVGRRWQKALAGKMERIKDGHDPFGLPDEPRTLRRRIPRISRLRRPAPPGLG